MTNIKIRDLAERVYWTAISATIAAVPVGLVLDVQVWKMALGAGVTAAVNAVAVIARWRLSALPDPGTAFQPSDNDGD